MVTPRAAPVQVGSGINMVSASLRDGVARIGRTGGVGVPGDRGWDVREWPIG